MDIAAAFACATALVVIRIASGDADLSVCGPPPEINGTVTPQSKAMEHPIGTSVVYNCPSGHMPFNVCNHISLCRINKETGRAEWTVPEITCILATHEELKAWKHAEVNLNGSCEVPFIENGEIGSYKTKYIKWRTHQEFEEVLTGENVDSGQTLIFRCKNHTLPVENSQFLINNSLKVTCRDGSWSKDLQCKETHCIGEPPTTKNGQPVIRHREHGFVIYYVCPNRNYTRIPGNVTCDLGSWTGIPPKCLDQPCSTRDLNYPGLVKPPQKYFENSENLEIQCEKSYKSKTRDKKISCVRGKWDISDNPCIFGSCEVPFIENGEMGSYKTKYLRWGTRLEFEKVLTGENVESGQMLIFRCNSDTLPVKNSQFLRNNSLKVTCRDGSWSKDLQCKPTHCLGEPPTTKNGRPVIQHREHGFVIHYVCTKWHYMKIPGNVTCSFGSWIGNPPKCLDLNDSCPKFPNSPEMKVTYSNDLLVGSIATFECSLSNKNFIGKYSSICQEIGSWSNPLPLCEDWKCSINDLALSAREGVVPDISNMIEDNVIIDSQVKLKCTETSIMTGDSTAVCGKYGTWKFGNFQCVQQCFLNLDPSSRLMVHPKKDFYQMGDFIFVSCPPGKEMSQKVERLMCLASRWSDSLPECLDT